MNYLDYDNYGFKRASLQSFAEQIGINLDTPNEKKTKKDNYASPVITEENKNNYDSEALIKEIEKLKYRIQELENERPILLKEYRDDDPLYLAIQIRNREWANYDPENDRTTRGNHAAITQELKELGVKERQAIAIELVACPINR